MLSISTIKGSSAYLQNNQVKSHEVAYYQEGGKAPSEWQGRGAEALGLSGEVDGAVLDDLLQNGTGGMKVTENHRKGADLTWSVPKSVSMAIEVAPPEMREQLLEACRASNRVVVHHLEDHVVQARYGKAGKITEKTGTAIVAIFEHDDARPVDMPDGSVKIDPDRHFHNAFVNATQGKNGEWRALDLDFGALAVEQHIADFKGKANLANRLQDLGFQIEKTRDGFEIAGISRDQIEQFSERKNQIDRSLEANGSSRKDASAAQRDAANLGTRRGKLRTQSQQDLRWEWRSRLREAGVDFDKLYHPELDQRNKQKEVQHLQENSASSSTGTNPSIKEQPDEQRYFHHSADDQSYPQSVKPLSQNGMRTLSGSGLDANRQEESAGVLPDYAHLGGPGVDTVRWEPTDAETGGLNEEIDAARQVTAHRAIDTALDHLSERESLFDVRRVQLEALKAGMGEIRNDDLESAMKDHGRLVYAGQQTREVDNGKGKFKTVRAEFVTTTETARREGWIQGFCKNGRSKLPSIMTQEQADKAVLNAEKRQGFTFAEDQKAVVLATLTTQDRVSALLGGAGTGKTTALQSMVTAARDMGYETVGLTPDHSARQELLDAATDENITVAKFLTQKSEPFSKPRLYILDEAGKVGDWSMQSLLQKMGPRDRILWSGDDAQTKPVEAGDPLKTAVDKNTIQHCSLTKVQRQARAEDKTLLAIGQAWADRDTQKALDLMRPYMTQVKVEGTGRKDPKTGERKATKEDRRRAIAQGVTDKYMARSPEDRARTMVICPTNAVREKVNTGIRARLQAEGTLPEHNEVTVTHLTKTGLTATQMRQAHNYEPGQILRTKEGKGEKARTVDHEITGIDSRKNQIIIKDVQGREKCLDASKINGKSHQLFDQTPGMGISAGDRLVMRDNSMSKTHGLQNGDAGHVQKIDGHQIIIMKMDRDGREVILDARENLAADYAYARTINDSQGKSVDLTLMSGEQGGGDSANLTGVGATRMRHGYELVTDHIDRYCQRAQAYADKNLATYARQHADSRSDDPRLNRLDAIIEKGKEVGSLDVENQLHPEKQAEPAITAEKPEHEHEIERER